MQDPYESIPRDPEILRLAHPQRCAASLRDEELDPWRDFVGAHTWETLKDRLSRAEGLTSDLMAQLVDEPEHHKLGMLTEMMAQSEGSFEMGAAFSTMLFLRAKWAPQPHFRFDDALVQMLEHTDISDDVPVSMLTLPFSRFYLELGSSRTLECKVPNPSSGLHVLEGAYFEKGVSAVKGPGVFVMLTGSPVGHHDALDDATCSMFIPTSEPERPLREVLMETRAWSGAVAQGAGLRAAPQEYVSYELDALMLLVKALLYLNLPQARQVKRMEFSEARAAALSKKNPAKRSKALAQAARLADVILVQSVTPLAAPASLGGTGRGVKAHWRRGHYRMQRHGVGLALQKLIFLQPVLVAADTAQEGAAPAAQYVVR